MGNDLTNAAKDTQKRGHVALSVYPDTHGLKIRMRDIGIGISTELLTHVSDLFAQ